jgi:uncharacterized protein (TIGR02145 family)
MLDNLRYRPNGDTTGTVTQGFNAEQVANPGVTNYLTQDGTSTVTSPNQDSPKYIDPIASTQGTNYCRTATNKSTYNITKCGLLYNYHTATAGTNLQANYSSSNRNASGSICPANWRLPSGYNASGDFGYLDQQYGGTGAYQSDTPAQLATLWLYSGAFAGVFSGYYNSSLGNQGSGGYFWSSSASSATYSYHLYFFASGVYPGAYGYSRYNGFGVRCVIGS